jgi:hypothetical protein
MLQAACVGRQLVWLHGAGSQSLTCRGEGVRIPGPRCVVDHAPVRVGGSSHGMETCRARRRLIVRGGNLSEEVPLVGNWSEMLPTGREQDILPVKDLTRVLGPPLPES